MEIWQDHFVVWSSLFLLFLSRQQQPILHGVFTWNMSASHCFSLVFYHKRRCSSDTFESRSEA